MNSFVLGIQIKILNTVFQFCLVSPLPDPAASSHSTLSTLQPHFVFFFSATEKYDTSAHLGYLISLTSIPVRWLLSWVLFPTPSSHRPTFHYGEITNRSRQPVDLNLMPHLCFSPSELWTHNLAMCLDWESNQQSLGVLDNTPMNQAI